MNAKASANSEFEEKLWPADINFQGSIGCGRVQVCCARPYFIYILGRFGWITYSLFNSTKVHSIL